MPKVIPVDVIHQIKFAVLGHPTHPMSIKAAALHFDVDRNTIRSITRGSTTGDKKTLKKKRLVPPNMTARRVITKKLAVAVKTMDGRKIPAFPAASIAKQLQLEHGIKVSYKTVQRDAKAMKLRVYVRPKRAEAGSNPDVQRRRLAFARSCKRRYGRLVDGVPFSKLFVFSDEHVSTANDHSSRVMYAMKRTDALPRERKAKHNTSNVQLWAAIGFNFKSKLVFIEAKPDEDGRTKRLNAEKYIRMCLGRSGVMLHLQQRRSIFMQDGARCHHANRVKYYLARKNILCIDDWPAHSPDLNPIEELWGYFERRRSEKFGPARSVGELKRQLQAVWKSIEQTTVNNFVASFELS